MLLRCLHASVPSGNHSHAKMLLDRAGVRCAKWLQHQMRYDDSLFGPCLRQRKKTGGAKDPAVSYRAWQQMLCHQASDLLTWLSRQKLQPCRALQRCISRSLFHFSQNGHPILPRLSGPVNGTLTTTFSETWDLGNRDRWVSRCSPRPALERESSARSWPSFRSGLRRAAAPRCQAIPRAGAPQGGPRFFAWWFETSTFRAT